MSDLSGLYRMSIKERREALAEHFRLDPAVLSGFDPENTGMPMLDRMVENVIGGFVLPIGVAPNFVINGREIPVPMATEEASVIAGASKIAKMAKETKGFTAECPKGMMIGQVQVLDVNDAAAAIMALEGAKGRVLAVANESDPMLARFGGGAKDLRVRIAGSPSGTMLIVHLLVDCKDAMGANAVNTMAEAVSPMISDLTGGRVLLRIISNLAIERIATANATFRAGSLGGPEVVKDIIAAYHFALVDPFRAATHNKGIMNGVSAVVRATGNDTRAIEAGAHAFASLGGSYGPLTSYRLTSEGDLHGSIAIPAAVGTVGGITAVHPAAKASLALMGIKKASELSEVLASVGLAQNLAALRALSSEGIQSGHMKLHARNLAIQSGASPDESEIVIARLEEEGGKVSSARVKAILDSIRSE
jgi:hydroxymethylglutaryl-CoA reductase